MTEKKIPLIRSSIHQKLSTMNLFTPLSTSSSEVLKRTGTQKDVTINHNRALVFKIINNIFDDRTGHFDASSSHCSSMHNKSSEYSFDKRLRYWKNMVEERKRITEFIKHKTGKPMDDVLFNRATTVDERDKQTVKRLMDYAERMNPLILMNKQEARLHEYVDSETCMHVNELRETLPQAEREGGTVVEISGLPRVTRQEQLGMHSRHGPCVEKPQWLNSKVLEQRIEERREDIERVIEYYPDIENLQVIGESLTKKQLLKHDSNIKLIYETSIVDISSESSTCRNDCQQEDRSTEEEPVDYGIKINEQIFKLLTKRSSKNVILDLRFECEPFNLVVKRAVRVENIGRKVINCEWVHRSYYEKTTQLLKAQDDEFIFNHKPFRLITGEVRDVIVQYQPRKVQVVKEKWLLKINPPFFCRRQDSVVLLLNGKCKPPVSYVHKINELQRLVIEKSNLKMMRKLTTGLASLTPLIKPNDVICPYKRALNERELFELLNVGYKCERFHDLELLKAIHKRVKKPREPAWDLKLKTLKALVLRLDSADRRAMVFAEMMAVLEEMKGTPPKFEEVIGDYVERDRSRLLFVRGIVVTSIDDWEETTVILEEAFLRPAIEEYYATVAGEEEEEAVPCPNKNQLGQLLFEDDDELRQQLVKKVRRGKAFQDSLYMQTYTHLCNVIEDIVSVIESTDVV